MRGFVLLIAACGSAPPPPSAPVPAPASQSWPGVRWDRAEAVRFNQVPYGPLIEGLDLLAWDPEHGLNPSIVERKPIDLAHATRAVELVNATGGRVDVSKCPFPRHGVVFYRGDQPVASVNVCFACGDILISPDPRPEIDDDPLVTSDYDAWSKREDARMVVYHQVYPTWQAFFRDDLGWSIALIR